MVVVAIVIVVGIGAENTPDNNSNAHIVLPGRIIVTSQHPSLPPKRQRSVPLISPSVDHDTIHDHDPSPGIVRRRRRRRRLPPQPQ